MDDIDHVVKATNDYAVVSEPSPFDKVFPEEPIQLSANTKRFFYQTTAGITNSIFLNKENKYHQIIFNSCVMAFKTDWFNGLTDRTKIGYYDAVRVFFDWINESNHNTTDKTRYAVFKTFEAYRLNEIRCKVSPLKIIFNVIKEGMSCSTIANPDYHFLQTSLSISTPVRAPEPESVTLSSWFDLPWLRYVIGEKEYLQLESPRLLFNSFRVTIATTLLYLLKQRQRWQQSSIMSCDLLLHGWQYDWNRKFLICEGKFNKRGDPDDEFSQLLWLDLVRPSGEQALKDELSKTGLHDLKIQYTYKQRRVIPWQVPIFFHPNNQAQYSLVEELMCAWLAACEAIQATDIPKLKTNNYIRERNASGRLIAMECIYYKGRSGAKKQPAILMGKDSWTQAMDRYMAGLSIQPLFSKRVAAEQKFPTFKMHTVGGFLLKIWKLPSFRQQLETELHRSDATPLFLNAMLALEQGDETVEKFRYRTGKTIHEYRLLTSKILPAQLFSLTHIKNTAVHAGADSYRAADLVNHHSHTSLTEKISYLTDKNKEWVNQAGRITRLVLNDLQNVVFQPSIAVIRDAVNDLEFRTQIIKATSTNNIVTHSVDGALIGSKSDSTIIVLDTNDTALHFIHYITQAEELLPKLLAVRPDWVERTLIAKIEWMTRTLTRMRATATAQKQYKELKVYLPRYFDHFLETIE